MKRLLLISSLLLLAGCGHKPAQVKVAPAPPPQQQVPEGTPPVEAEKTKPPEPPIASETEISPDTKPLLVETGIASWYGAPYHNRRGSNGEIYDMHALTAAHRTLPLGSIVRVTNLKSGDSVIVRITDRGPFIEGRIIDLSQAAAQKINLIRAGTGEVRVELLKTPQPLDIGGKWAVQIGAFEREQPAREIADHLSHRYRTAKILTFNSPAGDWWVRVRVKDDLRARAEEIVRDTRTPEGAIFLVRLD
ncbi:MAG TPA: septal ring lytic transglycosylase RlpA family protein [Terriglobales bacterium]|nr:septal ring lytic transglycosylase RlpA family protein [Terriglobales bacterium]